MLIDCMIGYSESPLNSVDTVNMGIHSKNMSVRTFYLLENLLINLFINVYSVSIEQLGSLFLLYVKGHSFHA